MTVLPRYGVQCSNRKSRQHSAKRAKARRLYLRIVMLLKFPRLLAERRAPGRAVAFRRYPDPRMRVSTMECGRALGPADRFNPPRSLPRTIRSQKLLNLLAIPSPILPAIDPLRSSSTPFL
jgi:hypothetical protein